MAKFRDRLNTGGDAVAAAATRSGGSKFTPRIKFEAGKTKYIQFLDALEDIPTVLLHDFIIVGEREDGGKQYATFISQRDAALDGADGYDELIDRFKSNPTSKTIGLAVELVPVYEQAAGAKRKTLAGFEVDTRQFENKDGETIEVPAVGLVVQSPSNFWGHVAVNDEITPIEETVFAVTRTGASTDTSYTFVPAGDALDLNDDLEEFFKEFDFDALLEEWADEERMRELIAPLPDDFVVNPYAKKDKKGGKGQSSGKSQRSRRTQEEDAEVAEEEEEAEAKPSRSRRFAALRQDIEK